jgi:adenylosuccinate synthase
MSLWIVVGGQFGSEGKGKIAAYLSLREKIDICIRCGGPNSGHSFAIDDTHNIVLRQLPTAAYHPKIRLLLPSGSLIDPAILKQELDSFALSPERVGIDQNAMIIEPSDKDVEAALGLRSRLSSTLTGVGSALSRRLLRSLDVRLAKDSTASFPWLRPYLVNTAEEANIGLDQGKKVLVEGTQGFGLSLYHSPFYPKTTSRDTSAAAFLSEVGLSPKLVTEIVLVVRTFPIRVAGDQAGPLKDEISWDELRELSGAPHSLEEYTTVTQKPRRVGRFDCELVRQAVAINRPTKLAVNFLDHLTFKNYAVSSWSDLTLHTQQYILSLEQTLKAPIIYCGTGPRLTHLIDRGNARGVVAELTSASADYR